MLRTEVQKCGHSLLSRLNELVVLHGHLAGQGLAAVGCGAVGVDGVASCTGISSEGVSGRDADTETEPSRSALPSCPSHRASPQIRRLNAPRPGQRRGERELASPRGLAVDFHGGLDGWFHKVENMHISKARNVWAQFWTETLEVMGKQQQQKKNGRHTHTYRLSS